LKTSNPAVAFAASTPRGSPRSCSGLPPEKWSSLKYGFLADGGRWNGEEETHGREETVKFGVFDHVDDSGVCLKEHLENRLKIIEVYDRCGIYILPLYHPLGLIEEICMLDNLSNGRFMLGMGRGISPIEAGFFGVAGSEMQARYFEASDILLKALQSETLTYKGK
jgi:Luciferase-like monooxygenase